MINDVKSQRLILSPYFQRNLVWRGIHKHDFIDTILKGFPFPQIFIARGEINVETMTSQSCVVDGQQRMNAIYEFASDLFPVNGKYYSQLDQLIKEEFLKYQVPVIDLEMKASDPSVIEVFQRLNRTFYSLSSIEKMSTEFASVDFMLIAKFLCGMLEDLPDQDSANLEYDPNMPIDFMPWAKQFDVSAFRELVTGGKVFTGYENSRMVHLMWTLNLLSTIRTGFFARNDKTKDLLEESKEVTPNRERLIAGTERSARFFSAIDFEEQSIWWNKSNSFSLMVVFFWNIDLIEAMGPTEVKLRLSDFSKNLPEEYALAAREAVNNRPQRRLRHEWLSSLLGLDIAENPIEGQAALI